jgi:hypothetical protein
MVRESRTRSAVKDCAEYQKACPMDSPANIRPGAENHTRHEPRELSCCLALALADEQTNPTYMIICLPWTFASTPSSRGYTGPCRELKTPLCFATMADHAESTTIIAPNLT